MESNIVKTEIWYAPVEKDGTIFENKIANVETDHIWSEEELKAWFVNWFSKKQEPAEMSSVTAYFYDDDDNEVSLIYTYVRRDEIK